MIKLNTMKKYFTIAGLLICLISFAQNKDKQAIQQLLDKQVSAWNTGNIDAFMLGYWENDSLLFMGKNGPTYGYNTTMVNYKKNYPDTDHMGQLAFTITRMQALNTDHYFIIGQFHLKRSIGDAHGNFTLLFRKIKGVWKIIADHTS